MSGDEQVEKDEVEEAERPARNEKGEWVCPECGEAFKSPLSLGAHRRSKHGIMGRSKTAEKERRRRGRGGESSPSRKPGAPPPRKQRVKQALLDLANLSDDLRGRETGDLPEHLADVIRRDADQLATMIATLAERINPVRFLVDNVLVVAAPVTAASGVLRWLLRAWRRQVQAEPDAFTVGENGAGDGEADWRTETVYGPEPEPSEPGISGGLPE